MKHPRQPSVLLVDDDSYILAGLKRAFPRCWGVFTATSATEAIDILDDNSIDYLITDMKMPGMSGGELLAHTATKHPGTVRFALSGYISEELITEALPFVHQIFAKPYESHRIIDTIETLHQAASQLFSAACITSMNGISFLPILPDTYEILSRTQVSIEELEKICQTDPGLGIKLLQLANTPYFNARGQVAEIPKAVRKLDKNILFKWLELIIKNTEPVEASLQPFFEYLLKFKATAEKIREIMFNDQLDPSVVTTSVLVSEVGLYFLWYNSPCWQADCLPENIAKSVLSAPLELNHPTISSYLCKLWNLPIGLAEAAIYHTAPWKLTASRRALVLCLYLAEGVTRHTLNSNLAPDTFFEFEKLRQIGIARSEVLQLLEV